MNTETWDNNMLAMLGRAKIRHRRSSETLLGTSVLRKIIDNPARGVWGSRHRESTITVASPQRYGHSVGPFMDDKNKENISTPLVETVHKKETQSEKEDLRQVIFALTQSVQEHARSLEALRRQNARSEGRLAALEQELARVKRSQGGAREAPSEDSGAAWRAEGAAALPAHV